MAVPIRIRLTRVEDLVRTLGPHRSLSVLPAWLFLRREFIAVAWAYPDPAGGRPGTSGARWTVLDEAGLRAFVAECPELTAREIPRRWAAGIECMALWHVRSSPTAGT
jgi:hypothetical protein